MARVDDGAALVEHVHRYYETSDIDLAIVTHPDGDHIGGMGEVIRGLNVGVPARSTIARATDNLVTRRLSRL